jgi:hypothetical protein
LSFCNWIYTHSHQRKRSHVANAGTDTAQIKAIVNDQD